MLLQVSPCQEQLPICSLCISLLGPSYSHVKEQIARASQVADLVELRLDRMEDLDLDKLRQLRCDYSIPMLFTLRKASQGGKYQGSEQDRLSLLASLASLEPEYIDLEAEILPSIIENIQKISPKTKWIISWHDFHSTPTDLELERLFYKMASIPADFYKIVTKANSICDSLRLMQLAKKLNAKKSVLCALCTGEEGQCTRILSPVIGNPFTFASLEVGQESAPGQLDSETLIQTYHFRNLNRNTAILGLIGDPVSQSRSHLSHNGVLRQLGINGVYVKFKVQAKELEEFMLYARQMNIRGLSVTMPHKEAILSYIDVLDPSTELVGACNTLTFTQLGIKGCNTDGVGALKAIGFSDYENKKMLILGAGGTAKSIAYEAKKQNASIVLLNRTSNRAESIAKKLNCQWGSLEKFSQFSKQGYDILIQATSVGMAPNEDCMPISAEDLSPDGLVFEAIWNPLETCLLQEARRKGCQTCSGVEMFIHQAVAQFLFWFGESIDSELVEKTIRRHLSFEVPTRRAIVQKSHLNGSITLPPSKSHSIRAILLGAMAQGKSFVYNPLKSPDIVQAIKAARQLGAVIQEHPMHLEIQGVAGHPCTPDDVIDAGNSGQVLRFVGALAALNRNYTVLTGDLSIRTNRPIKALLEGLRHLGAFAEATKQNDYAPIIIKGPLCPGCTTLSGEDSQPVSALLMAASFVEGETQILVKNPGEKPWIELTLSWLDRLKVPYTNDNFERFIVKGSKVHSSFSLTIPGDFSSAAFPIVAALLTQSELTIENVDMDDKQGDKLIIPLLQQMGAQIEIDSLHCRLNIKKGSHLKGQIIDINPIIDTITILAVVGCFAEGETHIINGSIAQHKECDRITCIVSELKKMGADIIATKDGLRIRQSRLYGASVMSYQDHRMALSLIVAGLAAEGETEIIGIECIQKSYPNFLADMRKLGALVK